MGNIPISPNSEQRKTDAADLFIDKRTILQDNRLKKQAYLQNERLIAYGKVHRLTATLHLATACIASLTAVRSSLQADCKTSGFAVLR